MMKTPIILFLMTFASAYLYAQSDAPLTYLNVNGQYTYQKDCKRVEELSDYEDLEFGRKCTTEILSDSKYKLETLIYLKNKSNLFNFVVKLKNSQGKIIKQTHTQSKFNDCVGIIFAHNLNEKSIEVECNFN